MCLISPIPVPLYEGAPHHAGSLRLTTDHTARGMILQNGSSKMGVLVRDGHQLQAGERRPPIERTTAHTTPHQVTAPSGSTVRTMLFVPKPCS